MIDRDELKSLLHYDPETGLFTWLKAESNRIVVGRIAGSRTKGDYVKIRIRGTLFLGHRLAWFYVYGTWPPMLDHKDRDKQNNRLNNLRETTYEANRANVGPENLWGRY